MSEIAAISRCIICNKPFVGPTFVKVGLGMDAKNNRIAVFVDKLTRHIVDEHKDVTMEILTQGAEYQGMLFLSKFQTDDPNLKEQLDLNRWKVHQHTLSARISDADIQQVIEKVLPDLVTLVEMKDTANLSKNLTGLLQSMRDRLEEPGKYTFAPFGDLGKAS